MEYEVYVLDSGSCTGGWASTIDYKIVVDTSADPGLTLEASAGTRYYYTTGTITGNVAITP